ncbi:MAG: hypothetical protein IKC75_05570 [Clostridia bacterium]|nr:hypothetical protein [Clostridia bacterium]
MKKRAFYLLPALAALVLEILPFGAVCHFALDGGETVRKTYSYFDLVPFGYANFAPFLTAIATLALIALLTVYLINGKTGVKKAAKSVTVCAFLLSLCPLLYGVSYMSMVGVFITLTLASEWLLIALTGGKEGISEKL